MKINCHCHIFSLDCVPLEFRKRFLLDIKNPIHKLIRRFLQHMLPGDFKLKDWLGVVDMSIFEIAQKLVSEMDEAGIDISTPLMMEFGKRCLEWWRISRGKDLPCHGIYP